MLIIEQARRRRGRQENGAGSNWRVAALRRLSLKWLQWSVALAVQDIARDKGRISVATGAATSALTGPACSPLGMHWVYDTYSLANSTARELLRQGGDSWFFITADYAFGHALEADATALIQKNGGKVVGSVRHPLGSMDFSSRLAARRHLDKRRSSQCAGRISN